MISVEQIARLAKFIDRYNNALDPLSEDCHVAKQRFDELAGSLHLTHAPDTKHSDFRYELVRQCREYLRKNRPCFPDLCEPIPENRASCLPRGSSPKLFNQPTALSLEQEATGRTEGNEV